MNKLLTAVIASAFAFAAGSSIAQTPSVPSDKTPSGYGPAVQAKAKSDSAAKKADTASMTKEQKAAAKKARNANKQAQLKTLEKTGDTGAATKSADAAKATAVSKAGPAPAKGTLNDPATTRAMQKDKGS
jgi:hypothetical protein